MFRICCLVFFIISNAILFCNAQEYNSVVISEIMADPTPLIGLPDAEYIELYNRTSKEISLKGWKLITGSRSIVFPDSTIAPGKFSIACHRDYANLLSVYGNVIGLSSLSLTNDGMSLALYNKQNQLVYSISYVNKWWDSDKRNGGYSLEMADMNNPCGEADNWSASLDERGGTPAEKNSLEKPKADITLPVVARVEIQGNKELIVVFNKRMDSLNAVSGSVITLSGRTIIKRQVELPFFHNLTLTLDQPLLEGQEYVLNIHNISDCAGNLLKESSHILALPSQADSGDIVINEILFNPRENGVDFAELYNRSKKYISLNNWTLGNTKNGEPNVFSIITTENVIMPPYSYLALTTEPDVVKKQYPVDKSRNFLEMGSFPAYSNADGGVILRDNKLRLFDKFIYSETMHHELLSDVKGVSLEKADVAKSSADVSNWHSAAATVGYATPGYANSQMKTEKPDNIFTVEPEAFTPDNDGLDDYTVIRYKQSAAGRIGALKVYNISGRLIRNFVNNQLIGTAGEIRWDGTDDQGQLVKTGYYLLLIDTFDTAGNTQQFKKRVIVARKDR